MRQIEPRYLAASIQRQLAGLHKALLSTGNDPAFRALASELRRHARFIRYAGSPGREHAALDEAVAASLDAYARRDRLDLAAPTRARPKRIRKPRKSRARLVVAMSPRPTD